MSDIYNFKQIELEAQKKWHQQNTYKAVSYTHLTLPTKA